MLAIPPKLPRPPKPLEMFPAVKEKVGEITHTRACDKKEGRGENKTDAKAESKPSSRSLTHVWTEATIEGNHIRAHTHTHKRKRVTKKTERNTAKKKKKTRETYHRSPRLGYEHPEHWFQGWRKNWS